MNSKVWPISPDNNGGQNVQDADVRDYLRRLYVSLYEYSTSLASSGIGANDHSALDHLDYATAGHTGFEPALSAGTTSQYYRGDKSWQTLPVGGVSNHAGLTNLDYASAAHTGFEPSITAGTAAQYFKGDKSLGDQSQFEAAFGYTGPTTWTPVDASGAGLSLTIGGTPKYVKMGSLVWATAQITYPATADATANRIGGLPFTVNNNVSNRGGGAVTYSSVIGYTAVPVVNTTQLQFWLPGTGAPTNAALSGTTLIFSVMYIV